MIKIDFSDIFTPSDPDKLKVSFLKKVESHANTVNLSDLMNGNEIHLSNDNFRQITTDKKNKSKPAGVSHDKLTFLNKGNTSKKKILDFYIHMIGQYYTLEKSKLKDLESHFNTEFLGDLYEYFAHSKYKWYLDSDNG